MQLDWLHLLNFKNCEERSFTFKQGITCITGPNGMGKTNLLDAIYYLCFTRSFINTSDTQNIRQTEGFFMIEGKFTKEGNEEHVQVSFKKGQKKVVRRNKKEYEKMADHIGLLPAVMICPQYNSIITGAAEERRKWLDMLMSQFDPLYLQNLINYQRILQQRNSLIKQMVEANRWDEPTLEVYDAQLAKYGHEVYNARKAFITDFKEIFDETYRFITNGVEETSLELVSQLDSGEVLVDLLLKNRGRDRALQYTTQGIHKDDLEFTIKNMSVKKFGSQGQQKSFLMALKIAEHHYLRNKLQQSPILMLDDIFDKLDEHRLKQLLKKVSSENYSQVLITDTGSSRLKELFTELGIQAQFYEL